MSPYAPYIVSSHFKEDLTWFKTCPYDFVVYSKQPEVAKQQISEDRIVACPNVANETGSYLMYIIEHYHDLPEYIAFIHGHETAYHQEGTILEAIQKWEESYNHLKFMSLNFPIDRHTFALDWSLYTVVNDGYGNCVDVELTDEPHGIHLNHKRPAKMWRDLQVGTDMPMKWKQTAYNQFVTHRDNIRRVPLHVFHRAWNLIQDENYVNSLGGNWHLGFGWEYLWPILLNLDTGHEPIFYGNGPIFYRNGK